MALNNSMSDKIKGWGVHLFTGMGLPLAFAGYLTVSRDARLFFIILSAAALVDGVDGYFARRYQVAEVVPEFDGRKLDDLIDFLNYVFLPVIAMWEFELLPIGWEWAAILPLMASGYGFSQVRAKTENAFVGFPSYWNVVVFYQVMLGWGEFWNLGITILLSILVFVPIHFLYPTKTPRLKKLTLALISLWGLVLIFVMIAFEAPWIKYVVTWSLFVPGYYIILSIIHTLDVNKK